MTLPATKATAEAFAAAVIPFLTTLQDARVAAGRRVFGLPLLPHYPETDGGDKTVTAPDRTRKVEKDTAAADPTRGYATLPTTDVLGFTTDPGTLEVARPWEVAPVQHADGYYDPPGTIALLAPNAGMSWARFQNQAPYTLPSTMDYAAEVGEYKLPKSHPNWTPANRGLGWHLTIVVIWNGRTKKHAKRYGFGPAAADYTHDWQVSEATGV